MMPLPSISLAMNPRQPDMRGLRMAGEANLPLSRVLCDATGRVVFRDCALCAQTQAEWLWQQFPWNTLHDAQAQVRDSLGLLNEVPPRYVEHMIPVEERRVGVRFVPMGSREGEQALVLVEVVDLTHRYQFERDVLFSHAAVESAPYAICFFDMDGRVTYANPAFCQLWETASDAVTGMHITEFPEDRLSAQASLAVAREQGMVSGETVLRTPGGRAFPVEFTLMRVPDTDGRAWGFIGQVQDLSERKKIADALHASERRFRGIFEHAGLGIILSTLDGVIADANESAMTILDVRREALVNTKYHRNFASGGNWADKVTQVIRGECTTARLEYELVRHDGHQCRIHLTLSLLRDEAGAPEFILSILEDVTESRRASDRLRQAAQVLASTGEGIVIMDIQGDIVAANPAFTQMMGYSESEVLGQSGRLLHSDHHMPEFYEQIDRHVLRENDWVGEAWQRRRDGSRFPSRLRLSLVRGDDGVPTHYVYVFSDITEARQSREQLDFLAHHDPLTALPNRLLFQDRLTHAIASAERAGHSLALLFVDLDRFKNVNDSLGHAQGDQILKMAAQRMRGLLRADDTVARLGGDEFVILLENFSDHETVGAVAQKLLEVLAEPFMLDERVLFIGGSIGIALLPEDGRTAETLLRNADTAMYQAKSLGRNNYQFYRRELTAVALERVQLESELRLGLERGEMFLEYQPQVNLHSGEWIGLEALLRWQHPVRGRVSPASFIPVAEKSGFIELLGNWVLREACRQWRVWHDAGVMVPRLSVNISGRQFSRGDLLRVTRQALEDNSMPAECLELEITESVIMEADSAFSTMDALRAMGVRLAVDDFGTGYSSLSYLKRLPIRTLKIDRSFLQPLPGDQNAEAIVSAILALSRSLGLEVIAEGVENTAQVDFLRRHDCSLAQGFLYSRALPAAVVASSGRAFAR